MFINTNVQYNYIKAITMNSFSRPTWNVWNLVLNGSTKSVEGWYSKFQKYIVTNHANICKFIEYFQKE